VDEKDERELLSRAQRGEVPAFEQLVAPLRVALFRQCRACIHDDDLAQHTALVAEGRAWFNIKDCRQAFRPWIFAIAHNAAQDVIRKPDYQRTVSYSDEDDPPMQNPNEPFEEDVIRRRDLEIGISKLSELEQAVLRLRYFSSISFAEVAEILGISPAYARKIHERAIKKLRKLSMNDEALDGT
jgi:RNA polymerase sigma factor (sigma-70 family)